MNIDKRYQYCWPYGMLFKFRKCSKVVHQRPFKVCFFSQKEFSLIQWLSDGIVGYSRLNPQNLISILFIFFFPILDSQSFKQPDRCNCQWIWFRIEYIIQRGAICPALLSSTDLIYSTTKSKHRTPTSRCCWLTWQFPCQKKKKYKHKNLPFHVLSDINSSIKLLKNHFSCLNLSFINHTELW